MNQQRYKNNKGIQYTVILLPLLFNSVLPLYPCANGASSVMNAGLLYATILPIAVIGKKFLEDTCDPCNHTISFYHDIQTLTKEKVNNGDDATNYY